jgi:uncharacterized Tic20 family protein
MMDDASDATQQNPYSSPGDAAAAPDAAFPDSDERLWAMLAHLAGILGYLGGIGQYVVPLVIYLTYKERSTFVAFHALQSLYFQLGVLAAGFAVLVIALVTCVGGLLALPLSIGALAYAIVAAIRANHGEWFEYWLVGPWARRQVIEGRSL